MAPKLKLLVAIHVVLAILPAGAFLVPNDIVFIPLLWAMVSVMYAQLMLLAVWLGLGTSKWTVRMASAVLAVAYLTIWLFVGFSIRPDTTAPSYFRLFASFCGLILIIAGVFLLLRRKHGEIRDITGQQVSSRPRSQFSILQLLLVTAVVAVLLALIRAATADRSGTEFSGLASSVLAFVVFLVTTLIAPWAVLSMGPVRSRVVILLLVALLLGIALALVSLPFNLTIVSRVWTWYFLAECLILDFLTVIVIVSLLVVRSCGYRLIRKDQVTGMITPT